MQLFDMLRVRPGYEVCMGIVGSFSMLLLRMKIESIFRNIMKGSTIRGFAILLRRTLFDSVRFGKMH
jgi:hypothetical protein